MDLSKFDDKTILIVGDAFLDIYKKGISTRLSPEFPVPVVNKIKEEIYLGGSLNVARNIKSIHSNCFEFISFFSHYDHLHLVLHIQTQFYKQILRISFYLLAVQKIDSTIIFHHQHQ